MRKNDKYLHQPGRAATHLDQIVRVRYVLPNKTVSVEGEKGDVFPCHIKHLIPLDTVAPPMTQPKERRYSSKRKVTNGIL